MVGASYGEGRDFRGQGLSVFLCAVIESVESHKFLPMVTVGSGLSFAEIATIRFLARFSCFKLALFYIDCREQLKGNLLDNIPDFLIGWPKSTRRDTLPSKYIARDKIFVVEVKVAELVVSDQYPAGLTGRFPRIVRLRDDKDAYDVATLAEVREYLSSGLRVTTSSSGAVDAAVGSKKRRRVEKGEGRQKDIVDSSFIVNPSMNYPSAGDLFGSLVFCVKAFVGDFEMAEAATEESKEAFDREKIIRLILENGGEVTANPVPGCVIITGSKPSYEVKALIEKGDNDVLHFSYCLECIRKGSVFPPKDRHFIGQSKERLALLAGTVDAYGDSYIHPLEDDDDLKAILNIRMKSVMPADWRTLVSSNSGEDSELKALVSWLRPLWSPSHLIYVDCFLTLGDILGGAERWDGRDKDEESYLHCEAALLRLYGARVTSHLTSEVSIVVIHPDQQGRRELLEARLSSIKDQPYATQIITPQWIRNSLAAGHLSLDFSK